MTETKWGDWTYNADNFTLTFQRGDDHYEVDLDECENSAQILDWLAQARKVWMTPEDTGHLVSALDAILGLQSNVCGLGEGKTIHPREVAVSRGFAVHLKARSARRNPTFELSGAF